MYKFMIKFSTFDDVNKFSNAVSVIPCDVEAQNDKYVINAKSIIGLFSLDLSKPIELVINSEDRSYKSLFKEWIVE